MKKTLNKFIFDVESDGLHGDAFSYAYIVLNSKNNIIKYDSCVNKNIQVTDMWVKENIKYLQCINTVENNQELRNRFYKTLLKYNDCEIWSDVNFPVETNFLSQIVRDDLRRVADMPFPLKDISTIHDITKNRYKLFNNKFFSSMPSLLFSKNIYELKSHNPLHDCIASAYMLTNNSKLFDSYYVINKELMYEIRLS